MATMQAETRARDGAESAPAIVVDGVGKRYGRIEALRGVGIAVGRGEIFGLLGPNGSGKTTTIKLLLGLLFPTDGEAFVFGQPGAEVK